MVAATHSPITSLRCDNKYPDRPKSYQDRHRVFLHEHLSLSSIQNSGLDTGRFSRPHRHRDHPDGTTRMSPDRLLLEQRHCFWDVPQQLGYTRSTC